MEKTGQILSPGTIRFERNLPGPIEKVWAYLTESEKRGKWLASGEMELFEGGKVHLHFLHQELSPLPDNIPEKYRDMKDGHHFTGTVLKVESPRLLAFTWEGGSEVTMELAEKDDRVLLTLTHRKLADDVKTRSSVGGGWHTHLDILIANLEGVTPPPFWSTHTRLAALYADMA
ncbi:SRPBCC family protein [Chitinophaga sp. RCC_12]|uniref:SRPBCC family protein n=1 Tax=unclassified Chitinophaga TaxID=2619133 RepID=UPI003524BCCE